MTRRRRAATRAMLIVYVVLMMAGIAWAQDFWTMCDEWGGRVLLVAAVLAAVAGPIAAWFRLDRRVAGVEDRQKLTDEKLNYLRDRVDGIQEALDGKLNRILELLARYFEDKH